MTTEERQAAWDRFWRAVAQRLAQRIEEKEGQTD